MPSGFLAWPTIAGWFQESQSSLSEKTEPKPKPGSSAELQFARYFALENWYVPHDAVGRQVHGWLLNGVQHEPLLTRKTGCDSLPVTPTRRVQTDAQYWYQAPRPVCFHTTGKPLLPV